MKAIEINTVRSRTMSHIIDDYKLQFSDHFSLKDQYEKRIEQERREKELLEQQLMKANKQRISTLAQNPVKKSNLAVGLLTLWAFISVLLLIFR
jgi:HrpA-like RNA helicase